MAKARGVSPKGTTSSSTRPPLTPEAKEQQMIVLALDLVEKRLREGTASSQETTHFLKLASSKARIEQEILERQAELISAKTKALANVDEIKAITEEALKAMQNYKGMGSPDEY